MAILDMSLEKLYEYRGISPLPEDFDEFWNSQLRELANLDIKLELKKSRLWKSYSRMLWFVF